MTDEQIIEAAKKIDTPYGKIGLIHVREDGQEVPTFMARQFANAILAAAPAQAEPIAAFHADLASKQEPLPADMQKVLNDNAWELYAPAQAEPSDKDKRIAELEAKLRRWQDYAGNRVGE